MTGVAGDRLEVLREFELIEKQRPKVANRLVACARCTRVHHLYTLETYVNCWTKTTVPAMFAWPSGSYASGWVHTTNASGLLDDPRQRSHAGGTINAPHRRRRQRLRGVIGATARRACRLHEHVARARIPAFTRATLSLLLPPSLLHMTSPMTASHISTTRHCVATPPRTPNRAPSSIRSTQSRHDLTPSTRQHGGRVANDARTR